MKKIYLTFVSLVVCFFFFSCQNDEEYSVLTTTSPSTEGKINEELENSKIENNAYKLASVLHNAITTKDNSFLKLLQKETKKKFDGDYDFLVSNFRQGTTRSSNDIERLYQSLLVPQNIDKSLYSRAHRAVTQSFLDNLLDSISKSEPLLNIYMPDWGDLSQYDDFLIVISPKEVNEHEEYTLKAYNMKGDTILLSSKKEPDLPYLVIGYNERVNVKTKMENSSSTFLRTPYYSYELKTEGLISSESLQITNNNNAKLENTKAVAIIINKEQDKLVEQAQQCGADEIIIVKQESHFETDAYIVSKLIEKYQPKIILIGETTYGKDLSAQLSANAHTGIACNNSDIEVENDKISWIRPSYNGKLNTKIVIDTFPQIGTFKAGTFRIDNIQPTQATIIEENIEVPATVKLTRFLGFIPDEKLMQTNIEDAEIIVSGGRGVGSKEGFEKLFTLAKLLGGNVGGTRPVCDDGWLERDRQIGITGKTVAPKLYIALGISGQVPHVSGMKESDLIIAVNTDKDAKIFDIAHHCVVADLHEVVDSLIEKLK